MMRLGRTDHKSVFGEELDLMNYLHDLSLYDSLFKIFHEYYCIANLLFTRTLILLKEY